MAVDCLHGLSDTAALNHERRQVAARGFSDLDVRLLFGRRQRVLCRLAIVTGGTTTAVPDGSGLTPRRGDTGYQPADMSTGKGRALAAAPGARGPRSSESKLPPGTHELDDMTMRRDGPPSKDFDLYGHYAWKFGKAHGDYWAIERVCAQAERDIERETGRGRDSNEDGRIRDARILELHAGEKPWHAATFCDCDPEYVRRLRIANHLDPDEGIEPLQDERTIRITQMLANGMSQRAVAASLGISQPRVSQILNAA